MAWNGAGVFQRLYSWQTDEANGIDVRADRMDTDSDDIASGISNCIARDGQASPTANIPFASYKITGLGNGSSAGDSVNYGQVFSSPAFTSPSAVASPAVGDDSLLLPTTSWVNQLAFVAALPAQVGNSGKVTTTDGTNASWTSALKATVMRFVDGTDATKKLAFDVSGVTTETTRTVTVPDKSGTLAMTSDFPVTSVATQAQMEAASDNTVAVSPLGVNWHPGAAKAWIRCDNAGNIAASYNITSITDSGTGLVLVTIGTDFSSANYAIVATCQDTKFTCVKSSTPPAAGAFLLSTYDTAGTLSDVGWVFAVCFGDQA